MHQPRGTHEPLDVGAALREELRHVRGIAPDATVDDALKALDPPLAALCFSGGGIRSAAFNLGVMRALAQAGVLKQFDYLSTVSGGGYIGGWLQTLITSAPGDTHAARVAAVEDRLKTDHSSEADSPLRRLRDFGNFLTPRTGLGSLDTWAGVTLYLRNLLLNWLMLLPVLLLAVLAPILHRTATWQAGMVGWLSWLLVGLAWLCLCWAIHRVCRLLPTHQSDTEFGRVEPTRTGVRLIVGAALIWAITAPLLLQHQAMRYLTTQLGNTPIDLDRASSWETIWLWGPLAGLQALAMQIGYWSAWFRLRSNSGAASELFKFNHRRWCAATIASSALLALAVWLFLPTLARNAHDFATLLTQFGPISLVLTYLVQSSFYIGLRREAPKADLDREWLARLDGAILATAAGWSVFAFACVSLWPLLYASLNLNLGGATGGVTAAGAAASGGMAAWLAKQATAWAPEATNHPTIAARLYAALPTLLSIAFLFGLIVVLSVVLQKSFGSFLTWLFIAIDADAGWLVMFLPQVQPLLLDLPAGWQWPWPDRLPLGWVHVVAQFLLAIVLWLTISPLRRININRFSMHGTYRNRLARAFLGTTRPERRPDWFTGFDEDDNPRLTALKATEGKGQKLFPVVNLALNRSSGGPAGRAERMAASYTATPLHCGSDELIEPVRRGREAARAADEALDKAHALLDTAARSSGAAPGPAIQAMRADLAVARTAQHVARAAMEAKQLARIARLSNDASTLQEATARAAELARNAEQAGLTGPANRLRAAAEATARATSQPANARANPLGKLAAATVPRLNGFWLTWKTAQMANFAKRARNNALKRITAQPQQNPQLAEAAKWAEAAARTTVAPDLGASYIATQDFAYLNSRREYPGGTRRPARERGISLGSVITASGAAASPHAGYHTNALAAFIMTLFNVRLGLWLPNHAVLPATNPAICQNRPPNALWALLGDLIGRTTLDNQAIYLSDGGHFDNLGLYEMLRRRCRYIVVIDAGADPNGDFSDLGMAIRKAEIDLPVLVTMGEMRIRSREQIEKEAEKGGTQSVIDGKDATMGVAVGKIEYLASTVRTPGLNWTDAAIEQRRTEAAFGTLIYIKPSMLAGIPAAARAYGREHEDFPHETTADQFFSESQFESYRVLGWWQTNWLTGGRRNIGDLATFFTEALSRVPAPK